MVVEGGAWTQDRLYQHRYTSDPACLLCGERGTFQHRCYECPATWWYRYHWAEGSPPDRVVRSVPAPALWERLLAVDPTWLAPPPLLGAAIVWVIRPSGGYFAEHGFGYGSAIDGWASRAWREGAGG